MQLYHAGKVLYQLCMVIGLSFQQWGDLLTYNILQLVFWATTVGKQM